MALSAILFGPGPTREGYMNSEHVNTTSPRPSRRASKMPPHVHSDSSIKPGVELIQLSKNESAISLQPAWMEAACRAVSAAVAYPDTECRLFRHAIGETFSLDP